MIILAWIVLIWLYFGICHSIVIIFCNQLPVPAWNEYKFWMFIVLSGLLGWGIVIMRDIQTGIDRIK